MLPTTLLVILAIVIRIISNPMANVFQKQLTSKGQHPLVVNFLCYFLLTLALIYFVGTTPWATFSSAFWLYGIAGAIIGTLGNALLIKALQDGELSVLGPINAYKSVVAMVVGVFMLGELPSVWGLAGVGLIIYGSYFVLDTTQERFSIALLKRKEIQYRIGAMVLSAVEAVFIKKVIISSNPFVAFVSWCMFGAVVSFILLPVFNVRMRFKLKNFKCYWPSYVLLIACIGAMQFTTLYVFNHIPVGYALSFFQLSTVLSVFLGYHIFKEQDMRKKFIGTAIMIVGSLILIWLNK